MNEGLNSHICYWINKDINADSSTSAKLIPDYDFETEPNYSGSLGSILL